MSYKDELANILSDLYKDVHGFRPRIYTYSHMSEVDLQAEIRQLSAELDDVMAAETARRAQSVRVFEERITQAIELGAGDRRTAIRWIREAEGDDTGGDGYFEFLNDLPPGYLSRGEA